jgi:hypothetical protein
MIALLVRQLPFIAAAALLCALELHAYADESSAPAPTSSVHAEIDPFPFATGRWGVQVGARPAALRGLRLSIASFSVDVPDFLAELGGNEGFHLDVRPLSGGIYALYYFAPPGEDGLTIGGSVRYLRLRFSHDDGGSIDIRQVSPEAIVGYQWHPFDNGFYVQPWLALGVVAWRSGEATVGTHTYDEMPVSVFFTANVGYERRF